MTMNHSFTYGVDWSDDTHFASHCWLPYSSSNSVASVSNIYLSSTNSKHTTTLPLVQCATCALTLRDTDFDELSNTTADIDNRIPSCRPSFFDSNTTEDISMYDQHCWSHVPTLIERCSYCNKKSLARTLYSNDNQLSIMSTVDHTAVDGSTKIDVSRKSDQNMDNSSSGLVCLWCWRSYHRKCWESMQDDINRNRCDYGTFGNIIVRPQWLRRIGGSRAGFRAELTNDLGRNSASLTPIIFFINKLAGGQKGEELYRKLVRLLNPRQVFLLGSDAIIIQALKIYSSLANVRICICGGDGTVGWVLSHLIDVFSSLENPPVGIYPLGTANDLSRVLDWGYRYDPKQLLRRLIEISHAQPIAFDRWQIQFEPLEIITTPANHENSVAGRHLHFCLDHPRFVRSTNQQAYENHCTPLNTYFFSHMSFGLDAAIALDFHVCRIGNPSKFKSPLKNKILYLNESRKFFKEFIYARAWNLGSYIKLICDGQDFTDSIRSCHTLVLLNSPGYASGTTPWGRTLTNRNNTLSNIRRNDNTASQISTHSTRTIVSSTNVHRFKEHDYSDGKIEILGLSTTQMALIHVGFRGQRIAQCDQVRIEISRPMPVQMDGEPFYVPKPIAINVTHAGQVLLLRNQNA